MLPTQVLPAIRPLMDKPFSAEMFLKCFSKDEPKNRIKEAAIAQDLGMVTCLARLMDINEGDPDTALSLALKHESLFAVRHLIELGADINKGHYPQGSILSYILDNGLGSLCTLVLARASKATFIADARGNTPLHYLHKIESEELVHRVVIRGKQLGVELTANCEGQTPCDLAISECMKAFERSQVVLVARAAG